MKFYKSLTINVLWVSILFTQYYFSNQFMMTTVKNLGVWMDHSNAHLIDVTPNSMQTNFIASQTNHAEKEPHQQAQYLQKIGDIIVNYEGVILFGPTDAKLDLLHTIIGDCRFANVKIQIKQTVCMTENQEHSFVKDYFLGH